LQPEARKRIVGALAALAEQPRRRGVRKLKQGTGWRLRVGDYRVLYEIDDDRGLLIVFAVGHRSRVYGH
jgi:mRNA interferase RelE/StbE